MSVDIGKLLGQGISFPPRVGEDGRIAWSRGHENVRESIRIILSTDPDERLMLSEFGGGLSTYFFEPNTIATRSLIEQRIRAVLGEWEQRIAVESVDVAPDPEDPRAAVVTLTYELIATEEREQLSLNVTLAS